MDENDARFDQLFKQAAWEANRSAVNLGPAEAIERGTKRRRTARLRRRASSALIVVVVTAAIVVPLFQVNLHSKGGQPTHHRVTPPPVNTSSATCVPATVASSAASSGGTWSIDPATNCLGPQGALEGVSCISATDCTAVGDYNDIVGKEMTLAEVRNGKQWTIEPTPNLQGGGVLSAVSCTAIGACTAVGSSYGTTTSSAVPLAEAWNGTSWTVEPMPEPSGGGSLSAVSCISATACMAVGKFENGGTLAERWSGNAWAVVTTPEPQKGASLSGVSCVSATTCVAVGESESGGGLVEGWDGTRWTVEHGPAAIPLLAVSCSSTVACMAVGQSLHAVAPPVLTERWNGRKWTGEPLPPTTGASGGMSSVSCSSPEACTAVGRQAPEATSQAVEWNGKKWTGEPNSVPTSQNSGVSAGTSGRRITSAYRINQLSAVSCTADAACTAVGDDLTISQSQSSAEVTFAEAWNGKTWGVVATENPVGAEPSSLSAVSCSSATLCTAVGYFEDSAAIDVTLAERWNGSHWKVEPTPNPAGAWGSTLSGVSCASAGACTAVGSFATSDGDGALAENWNGKKWTVEPTPTVPEGFLSAVSCISPTACTAVGMHDLSTFGVGTLAETWNGTKWTVEPTPTVPEGSLSAVSCVSRIACAAVGSGGSGNGGTLAEIWNGTKWTVEPSPSPGGPHGTSLSGVSCISATDCTVVGSYATGLLYQGFTLAELWNGTSWTVESTPNPAVAHGENSVLSDVSCTSATACTAVGYYYNSVLSAFPLAEIWNGTSWTIEPTPNPAGKMGAVSCAAAGVCTAVGSGGSEHSR